MSSGHNNRFQGGSRGGFFRLQVLDESSRQRSEGRVIRENVKFRYPSDVNHMSLENKETRTGLTGSKYWKLLLVILAGLFTFGAPYVVYIANSFLKRGVFFSFTGGIISLIIGLLLIWYLIRSKVIS